MLCDSHIFYLLFSVCNGNEPKSGLARDLETAYNPAMYLLVLLLCLNAVRGPYEYWKPGFIVDDHI